MTPEREQEIRERVAKAWLVDAKDAEIKLLLAALEAARVENERLREALKPLFDAANCLSFGEDWNNGTHAKKHGCRKALLAAIPAARNALGGDND